MYDPNNVIYNSCVCFGVIILNICAVIPLCIYINNCIIHHEYCEPSYLKILIIVDSCIICCDLVIIIYSCYRFFKQKKENYILNQLLLNSDSIVI